MAYNRPFGSKQSWDAFVLSCRQWYNCRDNKGDPHMSQRRMAQKKRSISLSDGLEYHDKHAYAQPLLVDAAGRILRFTLRPGQMIEEHEAPDSPFYLVVLKGHGYLPGPTASRSDSAPTRCWSLTPGNVTPFIHWMKS